MPSINQIFFGQEQEFLRIDFPQCVWGAWLHERARPLLSAGQLRQLKQLIANIEDVTEVDAITANLIPAATG